ncbi:fungal-specific transcription factor domain-containing protein [Mycena vulgaris]|nr:fungal-specific transcription factor domain-containing protein [Mycena vulgaris]
MPDGCSNCLAFGSACTYLRPTKKRGPKNKQVEELKQRNAALEAKLRSLSVCSLCAEPLKTRPDRESPGSSASGFTSASIETPADSPEHAVVEVTEDDFSHIELADCFRNLSIGKSMTEKFFGSSSSFALVRNAIAVKEKYLGRPAAQHLRRPRFWNTFAWEKAEYDRLPQYVYPPSDLIASLLELYFINVHPTIPVLHRPSFERSVADGLHLKNPSFGGALLAVLGVASRYSNDPRVFVDGDTSFSSGWNFVKQVQIVRKVFDPTLYDVQFYCLMVLFSLGTSAPQSSWLYLGLGIRSLQQRGEHRRKRKDQTFDHEEERWKRAFWCIFSLDRLVCVFLGRPAGLHSEDFDVDLPIEVDDEYWDQDFKQPPGKPSLLSYFLCHLRLCDILGDALRRLYASNKLKTRMGWSGQEWEQSAVAELDSAMNDWLDTVPPHLRWDPDRPPDVFFDQSGMLYATYYYIQIAIHRPYIHKENVLAAPSLSICTSAARSALHVTDLWLKKLQRLPLPFLQNPAFVSGVILILDIFGSKRAGLPMDRDKDLMLVDTAMELHKFAESRWQPAGRMWELLGELRFLDAPMFSKRSKDELSRAHTAPRGVGVPMLSTDTPSVFLQSTGVPRHDRWHPLKSLPSSDPPPHGNTPDAGISIEQLLADTAEFDTAYLPPDAAANGWNGAGQVDGVLDDEVMSLWMAAPTDFSCVDFVCFFSLYSTSAGVLTSGMRSSRRGWWTSTG